MKKLFNYLFVAIITVVSAAMVVNAADVKTKGTFTDTVGDIIIQPQSGETLKNGQSYSAYRILDLESYDSSMGAYSYTINSDWEDFITSSEINNVFVNVSGNYVTWKNGDIKEFAKKAYAYAIANGITADYTKTVVSNELKFTDIELGYYLVNSSLGVICSLDTTNNIVTIKEKNAVPTIDKVITTTGTKENSAKIGDTVPYTVTLTNINGLKNVVVRDSFTTGLTLNQTSIVVKNGEEVLEEGTDKDYKLTSSVQGFEIVFSKSYIEELSATAVIEITYSATVNKNSQTAVPNTNEVKLIYGNNVELKADPVKTYTYEFKIRKTNGNIKLDGAEFELYDALTGGNKIEVTKVGTDDNGINYYRVATEGETVSKIEAGIAVVEGLKEGTTYYLEEVKAPEGYNKLAIRVAITVVSKVATSNTTVSDYQYTYEDIVNRTGIMLPNTGGVGTTLFIVIGSILVLGFGITLITKYRISKEIK